MPHRILIQVYGGIADYVADSDVDVCLIDYDNEPRAEVPETFRDLLARNSDEESNR